MPKPAKKPTRNPDFENHRVTESAVEGSRPGKDETDGSQNATSAAPARHWKVIISIALVAYLGIVLLGPLSNPVGSEFLTRPLAETVAPIHRALFLGHGYRFFGPDPGPSHLVVYRITDHQGKLVEGHFPDRSRDWPRLMYHRWFMLSETVFNEHALTPDAKSFRETNEELDAQIKALHASGKLSFCSRLARERKLRAEQYQDTRQRIDELVAAIARHLMRENNGYQIELFVQERSIPYTVQVLTGTRLDDPQFLSPLTKIGEFRLDESGEAILMETLPAASGVIQ